MITDNKGLLEQLVDACWDGQVHVVRTLLHQADNVGLFGPNQSFLNQIHRRYGLPPLYAAIYHNEETLERVEIVKLLLSAGADPLDTTEHCVFESKTVLHLSAAGGLPQITSLFLEAGVDVNCVNQERYTPLHGLCCFVRDPWRSIQGVNDACRILLEAGANVSLVDEQGNTPLHLACQGWDDCYQDSTIFSQLLNAGADCHAKNHDGQTPLHIACTWGNSIATRILLQSGADPLVRDNSDKTALHYIIEEHDRTCFVAPAVIRLLLDAADSNQLPMVPIHTLCTEGQGQHELESLQLLLQLGIGILSGTDEHDRTPLMTACRNGKEEAVRLLLQYGAPVNAVDWHGQTALHIASENGRENIISLLIQHGAFVNARDNFDQTPLHAACKRNHKGVARVLLQHGVDVDALDSKGRTATFEAATKCYTNLALFLVVEHGANINASRCGWTALHNAAYIDRLETSLLLLNLNADDTITGPDSQTPFQVACMNGSMNVVFFYLQERGAIDQLRPRAGNKSPSN